MVLPYIDMNLPQMYVSSQPWTPLPPPSPYHLSGSSQCTSPKHPISCIEPRLAIDFLHDSIHVSMPFSPIIPPSPSPTESKILFYTSVCLLLSRIQGYRYHLSKFLMYASVYCIGIFLSAFFLSFFLTSLWFLESLGVFHWFDITQRSISLPICFLNMRDYFGNSYL